MDAIKYLEEKKRMLDSLGRINSRCVGADCDKCPLGSKNNGRNLLCGDFKIEYPEEVVAIVEKWSQEHPQKTILQDFLEKYPKAKLADDGLPESLCPYELGYEDDEYEYDCNISCRDCWNRLL